MEKNFHLKLIRLQNMPCRGNYKSQTHSHSYNPFLIDNNKTTKFCFLFTPESKVDFGKCTHNAQNTKHQNNLISKTFLNYLTTHTYGVYDKRTAGQLISIDPVASFPFSILPANSLASTSCPFEMCLWPMEVVDVCH